MAIYLIGRRGNGFPEPQLRYGHFTSKSDASACIARLKREQSSGLDEKWDNYYSAVSEWAEVHAEARRQGGFPPRHPLPPIDYSVDYEIIEVEEA